MCLYLSLSLSICVRLFLLMQLVCAFFFFFNFVKVLLLRSFLMDVTHCCAHFGTWWKKHCGHYSDDTMYIHKNLHTHFMSPAQHSTTQYDDSAQHTRLCIFCYCVRLVYYEEEISLFHSFSHTHNSAIYHRNLMNWIDEINHVLFAANNPWLFNLIF